MSHYTHLTIGERDNVRVLWEQGLRFLGYVLKKLQMKWILEQDLRRIRLEKQVFSLLYNTI